MGKDESSFSTNAVIEVSLSAVEHNLGIIKNRLPAEQLIMGVVKANAYGHGDTAVAGFLQDRVDWFAVNSVQEGIRLREHGIKNSILVFGVPEPDFKDAFPNYNLTATVSDLSHFDLLGRGTEYHLNLDTGMGRLGILPGELSEAVDKITAHSEIRCTGLYSHFATADEPGSDLVHTQLKIFRHLQEKISQKKLIHIANSGGIFFYPESGFDMVRAGISLYGYAPGKTQIEELRPALKFSTHLVQVKRLDRGETVSYGARWQADKPTNIGIIPVGYEDGISRNLTGQLNVEIEGEFYPVVGTITMNYCMVDLGADDFNTGTKVYLLNGDSLNAKKWADNLNTISYEILTGLSGSVQRIYSR